MRHIIKNYSYNDVYTNLSLLVNDGYVKKTVNNTLELYNYTSKCTYEKYWNDFTLSARGLILSNTENRIVALPFPKFFNYGEQSYNIPDLPFTTLEKYDGSLGIIYFYQNNWHVATRGSFNSSQANWAKTQLANYSSKLDPSFTYLVEIIYKANQIVVYYPFEGLVLLGGYHTSTGQEIEAVKLHKLAKQLGLYPPKFYQFNTLDSILELSKTLDKNKEGFVVTFNNGLRIKIKGDEYCRVHALVSNVSPLALWNCMFAGDDLTLIKKELPEEYYVDFDKIITILRQHYYTLYQNLYYDFIKTRNLTDKEIGLSLNSLSKVGQYFIFSLRNGTFLKKLNMLNSPTRRKFFELFRPKNNILVGYTASTTVSRFYTNTTGC